MPDAAAAEGGPLDGSSDGPDPFLDGALPDVLGPDAGCEGDRYGFAISNVDRCLPPAATTALDFSLAGRYLIDTDTGEVTSPLGTVFMLPSSAVVAQLGGGSARVSSSLSWTVAAGTTVDVIGAHPLIILSRGDVTISGSIDVRSSHNLPGAGARTRAECGNAAGGIGKDSTDPAGGGGGGGGGAFRGDGADGGDGAGTMRGVKGAKGGKSGSNLVPLKGGCPGGPGGAYNQTSPDEAAIGGDGGAGGGALQISSGGTIRIDGVITVSGGGGAAAGAHTGGGGGGSGGGLLLEARTSIALNGELTANGGGGASGGGVAALGDAGENGSDNDGVIASGGDCNCSGGLGGAGGAGGSVNGTSAGNATSSGGGGGGGGGVGEIFMRSPSIPLTGYTSPTANKSGL